MMHKTGRNIKIRRLGNLVTLVGMLLYLSLFLYGSLTRTRLFSPDSMNYVDIARNIRSGKGIVQSTLGFNQPFLFNESSQIPTPVTSQPPLYPILIATVSFSGLSQTDAALVISVVAYGCILLLLYLLAKDLFGEHIASLSLGCLLIFAPLRYVARYAWTEPLGIALVLASLWLLLKIPSSHQGTSRSSISFISFGAGLLAGLAFTTRYALLPLLFVEGLFLAIELRSRRLGPHNPVSYLVGFGIPAFLVLGHNVLVSGSPLSIALPSDQPFIDTAKDAFFSTGGNWLLVGREVKLQSMIAVLAMTTAICALSAQHKLRQSLLTIFVRNRRYLCTLWVMLYFSLLVWQRTVSHFDGLNPRLTVPSDLVLLVLCVAFLSEAFVPRIKVRDFYYNIWLLSVLLLVCCKEAQLLSREPRYQFERQVAQSERLGWIVHNTTNRDLIIGDDTMDIPFYISDRDAAVSFSPYPYTMHLEYAILSGYVRGTWAV